MPRHLLASLALALTLLALPSPRARAEDAVGPAAPKTRPAIAHPYLDSLVGSWDVSVEVNGMSMKGTSRWWKGIGGTALLEDFTVGEGDMSFFGFGVLRLGADGKKVARWWFDSEGQGAVEATTGTVTAEGYESSGEFQGTKFGHSFKKTAAGHEFSMTRGGQVLVTAKYEKAKAEHPWTRVLDARKAKHPLLDRLLGEWAVKAEVATGAEKAAVYDGTTSFRHVVGGSYVLQEHALKALGAESRSIGVSSLAADGKSQRTWWFSPFFEAPFALSGDLAADSFRGAAKEGPLGAFTVTVRLAGDAVELTQEVPQTGTKRKETWTRAK